MITPLNNNQNNTRTLSFGNAILSKVKFSKIANSPIYGIDYDRGDIGFTVGKSIMSKLIRHFTRWHEMAGIAADHIFIVAGEAKCIEAHSIRGVINRNLKVYFNNKNVDVFFVRPKGINPQIADEMVGNAQKELDKKYSVALIINNFLRGTHIGHMIDKATNQKLFDRLSVLLSNKNSHLCSQLIADSFQKTQQWSCHNTGILKRPAPAINPEELVIKGLFGPEEIFEPRIVAVK